MTKPATPAKSSAAWYTRRASSGRFSACRSDTILLSVLGIPAVAKVNSMKYAAFACEYDAFPISPRMCSNGTRWNKPSTLAISAAPAKINVPLINDSFLDKSNSFFPAIHISAN